VLPVSNEHAPQSRSALRFERRFVLLTFAHSPRWQPKSECFRRTLRTVDQKRMSIYADALWRSLLRRAFTQFIKRYHFERLAKAKAINCSSLLPSRCSQDLRVASNIANASVDYPSLINALHEYFADAFTSTWRQHFIKGVQPASSQPFPYLREAQA
jgi:hypothetical protein